MTDRNLADLAIQIHADNVAAGWWTDLKTGESLLRTRNRPEMLMLAVSEIAEAAEGIDGRMDDKLPHLPMYDVELADFVIRQMDQIGAEVSCGAEMPKPANLTVPFFKWLDEIRGMSRHKKLLLLVRITSCAMEHYRKGEHQNYVNMMASGVMVAFSIGENDGIDLWDIIQQKREFNRNRADHKIENRLKAGGKSF